MLKPIFASMFGAMLGETNENDAYRGICDSIPLNEEPFYHHPSLNPEKVEIETNLKEKKDTSEKSRKNESKAKLNAEIYKCQICEEDFWRLGYIILV